MPEALDRTEFLRRVAVAVDLQPTEVDEVIEELDGHLSDAAAAWLAAGYRADDAEVRAIRGLGDPASLGRSLGTARHRTRHLLAGVGGAVFHTLAFGIWAYLTLWIVGGGLALIGGYLAWWALTALGGSASGWFTGLAGSAGRVMISILWFAWLGWVLPARVARSAHRSVRGVQTALGSAGFVVATAILWSTVRVDMDPVLAVCLPLGPFAFLIATRRPSPEVSLFPATTRRMRVGVAADVVLCVALAGLVTVDRSGNGEMGGGWDPGLASLGADPMTDPVFGAGLFLPNPVFSTDAGPGSPNTAAVASIVGGLTFAEDADVGSFERHVSALELEILPASLTLPASAGPGTLTLRGDPVATARAQLPVADLGSAVRIDLPVLRTQTQLVAVLLGRRSDGTRVVLGFDTMTSPAWHGTLADWWFTSR